MRLALRSPPPVRPIPEIVVVLSALVVRVGTVGEEAVPARSPASWTMPLLVVVASFTVVLVTVPGSQELEVLE